LGGSKCQRDFKGYECLPKLIVGATRNRWSTSKILEKAIIVYSSQIWLAQLLDMSSVLQGSQSIHVEMGRKWWLENLKDLYLGSSWTKIYII